MTYTERAARAIVLAMVLVAMAWTCAELALPALGMAVLLAGIPATYVINGWESKR